MCSHNMYRSGSPLLDDLDDVIVNSGLVFSMSVACV